MKHFFGATTDCMKAYVKPFLRNPLDHFILHVGTNDLISNQTSEEIATSMILHKGVSLSSIILRTDDKWLLQKGCEENDHLKEKPRPKTLIE